MSATFVGSNRSSIESAAGGHRSGEKIFYVNVISILISTLNENQQSNETAT